MKRVKGCLNPFCEENKKRFYKEADVYCVKCGSKLGFVCRHPKCFKQLPDDGTEKYCALHIAEKQDKKEKYADNAKKIVGVVVSTMGVALTTGKTVIDIVKKH